MADPGLGGDRITSRITQSEAGGRCLQLGRDPASVNQLRRTDIVVGS